MTSHVPYGMEIDGRLRDLPHAKRRILLPNDQRKPWQISRR